MNFNKFLKLIFISILLLNIICQTESTLGPGDKKKTKHAATTKAPTPTVTKSSNENELKINEVLSVEERGLITKNIESPAEIIDNHMKYCSKCIETKLFKNKVLGYVTPWNLKGYEIGKRYANKFNMLSPVWLQIKKIKRKTYEFTGTHDIDTKWMDSVKRNNKENFTTSFVPRILFEKWKPEELNALFNDEEEMSALVEMLVKNAKKYKFKGYSLEIYMQLNGYSKPDLNHFITDLANGLHKEKKLVILVIPPALSMDNDKKKIIFDKRDFDTLKDTVDYFSLMTYDFNTNNNIVGPNAPLEWIKENVVYFVPKNEDLIYRGKILLGLNFYGMKFKVSRDDDKKIDNVDHIAGHSFIDLLKRSTVNINYEPESVEHMFHLLDLSTKDKFMIMYPTLYSINKRIQLANQLGTGLSIWELGQGLDYWYDLF